MNFIQETLSWFKEMVFLIKMKLKLKMYMKLADYKHFIMSKRYFVIPSIASGLDVICADQIQEYKKNGIIRKHDGYLEISAKAFYITATQRGGNDSPTLEQRRVMMERYQKFTKMVKPFNPQIMKRK